MSDDGTRPVLLIYFTEKATMSTFDKVGADLLAGLIQLENATDRMETLPDPVVQVLVTGEEMLRYTCRIIYIHEITREGLFRLGRKDGQREGRRLSHRAEEYEFRHFLEDRPGRHQVNGGQ